MSARPTVAFVLNLVQDVNIVRMLVYLAAREFDADILVLASDQFFKRDKSGMWARETETIVADTDATLVRFGGADDLSEAYRGRRGIVFSASESDFPGHHETHLAHRLAAKSFLRVTLQHGYECIGFMQNREHVIAHGENVTFGADVIAAWADPATLASTVASQRPKVAVTGPATLLQKTIPKGGYPPVKDGLVCENLHSVRLNASGSHGASFLETFEAFCTELGREGRGVTLRPHPSGKYMRQNHLELLPNVTLNDLPVYRVDLSRYAYGISAPSSVLLDMVLAGIPVAVWHDRAGMMDTRSYHGLTFVSGFEEWLAFERDARLQRRRILAKQRQYLANLGVVTDPNEVYRRFARLIASALKLADGPSLSADSGPSSNLSWVDPRLAAPTSTAVRPRSVLFVAAAPIPTLEISFLAPLADMMESGEIRYQVLAELDLDPGGQGRGRSDADAIITAAFDEIDPEIVVFCRYGGVYADRIVAAAHARGAATVLQLDDNLLDVPADLGARKQAYHMHPRRQNSIRHLLQNVDLIYCSTPALKDRLSGLDFPIAPLANGAIFCASDVLVPAALRPVRTVGYMGGGDHAHDFAHLIPELVNFLDHYEDVTFELFSSMPMPVELAKFGNRARRLPVIPNYDDFRVFFQNLGWDIGLCPLRPIDFNAYKADTKWVEYTSVGTAVVASAGLVYDGCCNNGCGLLVRGQNGWFNALETLTCNPELRYNMVKRAQRRLVAEYGVARLRHQVLEVFALALAEARGTQGAMRHRCNSEIV